MGRLFIRIAASTKKNFQPFYRNLKIRILLLPLREFVQYELCLCLQVNHSGREKLGINWYSKFIQLKLNWRSLGCDKGFEFWRDTIHYLFSFLFFIQIEIQNFQLECVRNFNSRAKIDSPVFIVKQKYMNICRYILI
eukprot:TRINITY_DN2201_c0_g1_i9.p3 TRINITY_DN2201_c0_g1~~TRINITY_DN2201_c0_g1_i9.p3  ORF type:complete len:137 (+),score=2.54 TRINITY_DN2201_c0_g1_i9:540-950(+)